MAERSRALPSLDLLKGFEAAARHLNFTRAADELFLTQSAVSRQVQTLEDNLGVRLFVRQRRGLALTRAGDQLLHAVQGALRQVHEALDGLTAREAGQRVTVTSTMGFCSLWLIPRLGEFHRICPEVDVRIAADDRILNLERERIDLSVRYLPAQAPPSGAVHLFDEQILPVCTPALLARARKPLRRPEDLAHYVLLHLDDRDNPAPWLSWAHWLAVHDAGALKPAGSLSFNYFDQTIRAALAGQGVALGRVPLIRDLLRDGSLVAPFGSRALFDRAYFLMYAEVARARPEVARFAQWLIEAARADTDSHLEPEIGAALAPAPAARRAPASQSATMARRVPKIPLNRRKA
jgi:DNA-binding transcriptional LysR family regulator